MTRAALNKEMIRLGLSPKHAGFYYIGSITERLSENEPEDLRAEYRRLCEEMPGGRKRAEGSMSYSIKQAWNAENAGIRELFPNTCAPPSAMELVMTLFFEMKCMDEEHGKAPRRIRTAERANVF